MSAAMQCFFFFLSLSFFFLLYIIIAWPMEMRLCLLSELTFSVKKYKKLLWSYALTSLYVIHQLPSSLPCFLL